MTHKSGKLTNNLFSVFTDPLIIAFATLLPVLLFLNPVRLYRLPSFIHVPTIVALTALLIITTVFKTSGFSEFAAISILNNFKNERNIWIALVLFSALLSCLLTNDIALFLVIPLTLQMASHWNTRLVPLLIFETIAVNTGSLITPIGNPQNIYLWQKFDIGISNFIAHMLPLGITMLLLLIIGIMFVAPNNKINDISVIKPEFERVNIPLATSSFLALIGFLTADSLGYNMEYMIGILLLTLLISPKILRKVDWGLLLLFLLMFVDMGIISEWPLIQNITHRLALVNPISVFGAGIIYSQVISNVPATLLLSKFTDLWFPLAIGVNLGGSGLLIGSFANIIAVRIAKKPKMALEYHYYALPFFIISILVTWILIL